MGIKEVKDFFATNELAFPVIEFEVSTATVELAAQALGVKPELIAKTMSFKLKDEEYILVLAAGDRRIDNRKFKDVFKSKAKMLNFEEVPEITGHPVGGVCPFGLKDKLPIYLDVSLQKYEYVYPAAGSPNSAVRMTPGELKEITKGQWIDVCKDSTYKVTNR